ncbi:hypothetical protein FDP41_002299 [Naegleria fowleri]|uniref:SMP-30/Gluconolactonase/LRE-like region domain-containing protein n=1 Tax=Naegleria fowleri TaxID=5763 RepID=A0A6A5BZQ8_NAEFO|nr:uncharacterized protein FDP41_002299 [Naegleria fowleri]KAF0978479.1 hypothetical protein FDP41_002299 [Naegleria fowleri]
MKHRNDDQVILNLLDFGHQDLALDPNFGKLRIKMRKSLKQAFSMRFDLVHTMNGSKELGGLKSPSDVKISYNNNCIVVGDRGNSRVQFFDYTTKLYLATFKVNRHFYCFLIENGEYKDNDYFILNDEHTSMTKYHLASLINHCKGGTICNVIWENHSLSCPYGMAIRREKNQKTNGSAENWIYVCNSGTNSIVVVRASDGTKITEIESPHVSISQPYGIEFIVGDTMLIVSEYNNRRCVILKQDENENWLIVKTIYSGQIKGEDFDCPLGITYDKIGRRIFVCDQYKNAIRILDEEGNMIDVYKAGKVSLKRPFGITFDERKGELYVTQFSGDVVTIFK